MATPTTIRKGRALLISSDACPRNCRTGANGSVHLLSDHSDTERGRQCTLCSCVIQDTHEVKPG